MRRDATRLWTSPVVELKADTVVMLADCTLKVSVYQARQWTACFWKDKMIGQGEMVFRCYEKVNENKSETIKIPISAIKGTAVPSPQPSVVCEIRIEFKRG
ncbi:hypothetical protein GN958_ATG19233 [Phytophthora infestans]|uniref:Uncharacterized protein n=2 Tax=Phytophthora infestans TaxID=4787 RepID=A0A8S9TXN5_PHYIN|nr:hypothetical protein GN958_ATG19233 [Phytophthora infestans]